MSSVCGMPLERKYYTEPARTEKDIGTPMSASTTITAIIIPIITNSSSHGLGIILLFKEQRALEKELDDGQPSAHGERPVQIYLNGTRVMDVRNEPFLAM